MAGLEVRLAACRQRAGLVVVAILQLTPMEIMVFLIQAAAAELARMAKTVNPTLMLVLTAMAVQVVQVLSSSVI